MTIEDLKKAVLKGHAKKVKKMIQEVVANDDKSYFAPLLTLLRGPINDGNIKSYIAMAVFRLNRTSLTDCSTIYMLEDLDNVIIQESLLDVLGYDKMVPAVEDQRRLIEKFFHYGDGTDLRYFADPRYGLAAACAGWEEDLVKPFLHHCLQVGDAPLRYVAEHALKGKYVKLRAHP